MRWNKYQFIFSKRVIVLVELIERVHRVNCCQETANIAAFYQQNGFGDLSGFRVKFMENIKNAYDAGVLIAGGSDMIYASLWDGEVMHRELELLVKAGISEVQAIKCCTHNGAKILRRQKEFGSLQKGMSADLLIVEGNPAKNISDTRNVQHVFLRGKRVDRESLKLAK